MIRCTSLALILCLVGVARAGDGDAPAKAPPAPRQDASGAPAGFKASLKLRNGRTMSGVVRVAGVWEREDVKTGWTACGKDERGACVRLWYVRGNDGFMVIAATQVESVENLGAMEASDVKKLAEGASADAKRAQDERDRLRKERDVRRAAEAAAEATTAPSDPNAAKKAAEAAARAKADAALLAKFPPAQWTPERRDLIEHRRRVLHINPTAEERDYVANYDAWLMAAAAAKLAEAQKADAAPQPKDAGKGSGTGTGTGPGGPGK